MDMGDGSLWPTKLAAPQLEVWREAMAHLRHLSDDVWKGLRLFLSLHAILFIIISGTIALVPLSRRMGWVLAAASVIGVLLALAARFVLKRHRIYYLEMLAKRALLEAELGFYEARLAGTETDLAFPWRLKPEVVADIKRDSAAWIQK